MHEIRTAVGIAASPARVGAVLTDFAAYPEWNPFIVSAEGSAGKESRLVISVHPSAGKRMTFRPKVLAADPGRELRWRGHFLVRGLFEGEHYFQLAPDSDGGTTLVHGERFSGLLVPLARSSLDAGTRTGFVAMNEALKARGEAGSR